MEYVYLMINTEMPGLVKVGMTTTSPTQRAKELSRGTGVPGEWVVHEYWETKNSRKDEKIAHNYLGKYRLGNKEIFRIDAEEGVERINYALQAMALRKTQAAERKAKRLAERQAEEARIIASCEENRLKQQAAYDKKTKAERDAENREALRKKFHGDYKPTPRVTPQHHPITAEQVKESVSGFLWWFGMFVAAPMGFFALLGTL